MMKGELGQKVRSAADILATLRPPRVHIVKMGKGRAVVGFPVPMAMPWQGTFRAVSARAEAGKRQTDPAKEE